MENHKTRTKQDVPVRHVIFISTGKSSLAQMAEAFVNARLSSRWRAFSAQFHPNEQVHPNAIRALDQSGIKYMIEPKTVDEFYNQAFDLVVTMDEAAAEKCPAWLGDGKRCHLNLTDPLQANGSEAELLAGFQDVLRSIALKIPVMLKMHEE